MLIIASGPSGAGKGAILKKLCEQDPKLRVATSWTTRERGPSETHQVDYHFASLESFAKERLLGRFLESAEVHGNWYGTHREDVNRLMGQGYDVILEIDCQGARQIRSRGEASSSIFILPPSYEALETRLTARRREKSEADIRRRLENARHEVRQASLFTFWLENQVIDETVRRVQEIIAACRRGVLPDPFERYRDPVALGRIQATFA